MTYCITMGTDNYVIANVFEQMVVHFVYWDVLLTDVADFCLGGKRCQRRTATSLNKAASIMINKV